MPDGRFSDCPRRLLTSAARMSSRACAAPVGGRLAATTAQMSRRRAGETRHGHDVVADGTHAHWRHYCQAEAVRDQFGEVLHVLRHADASARKPCCGARDVDLGLKCGVGPAVDEVPLSQRASANSGRPVWRGVAPWDGEDQLIGADLDPGHGVGVGGTVDEGDVQLRIDDGAG